MTACMDGDARSVTRLSASRRALLARRLRVKAAAAQELRRSAGLCPDGPLVRMTPGAERDPLFFVHAVSGTVHAYARLATHLAEALTLYGIEAAGLREGSTPRATVEDMAVAYLHAIRRAQPHGPYRIGGWSMGGLVAFDIARQLEAAGDEVALLALLDTAVPSPFGSPLSDGVLAAIYAANAAASLGVPFELPLDFSSWTLAPQLRWISERLGLPAHGHDDQPEMMRHFAVFKANVAASRQYQPRMVRAPTLVIGAADSPNHTAGWAGAVMGECTVVRVPGTHYTLLQAPQVGRVATTIRTALSP